MGEWRPIETAPEHENILLYRPDAGVMFGQFTYLEGWLTDQEAEYYDEETLFQMDFWSFGPYGPCRLEGEERPTMWARPAAPEE